MTTIHAQTISIECKTAQAEAASRVKSKTSFRFEAHLIDIVFANMNVFLPREKEIVASKEVEIGAGRVDIVLAAPNMDQLIAGFESRDFSKQQVVGKPAVILNKLFYERPLKTLTIGKKAGLDIKSTRIILDELTTMGLVHQYSSETFVRTLLSRQFNKVVSIEGKLSNWQNALAQAYRNKLFSMYSYVVMDAKHVAPALKGIARFQSLGVGLAVASADTKKVSIIYRPSQAKPISSVYYWLATEVLRSKIKSRQNVFLSKGLVNVL